MKVNIYNLFVYFIFNVCFNIFKKSASFSVAEYELNVMFMHIMLCIVLYDVMNKNSKQT